MSSTSIYRLICGLACATGTLMLRTGASFADAATHELSLVTSSIEGDCGGGSCTPMCSFKAELKNVGHGTSRPIAVYFHYPMDKQAKDMGADQDGEKNRSTVALFFSELKPGATDKTLDDARGASCEDLAIDEIEVNCPEETDDKCPGFYYVDIPVTKSPMIAHQKIEGK
ncbi:hypothetical protein ELI00_37050 [Rhizobium ruizarguesonis]|uniref:hypothetical protein n=1 Tax=Rhizobium ruizarguesonis TaxID=2081791 RepID=UPI00103028ED|nr:hypothetical protein [Rhizobium ruizarguesonis]TAX63556.1 hypothetical protein ELI00_37050 [Rhizobium ruizarguesonis]